MGPSKAPVADVRPDRRHPGHYRPAVVDFGLDLNDDD